jgi:hypothetical protein
VIAHLNFHGWLVQINKENPLDHTARCSKLYHRQKVPRRQTQERTTGISPEVEGCGDDNYSGR